MEYRQISSEELLEYMARNETDFMLFVLSVIGGKEPKWVIAKNMKTSIYQVSKCMNELKAKGLVELTSFNYSDEYESFPPVEVYGLTEKAWKLENIKLIKEENERNMMIHLIEGY